MEAQICWGPCLACLHIVTKQNWTKKTWHLHPQHLKSNAYHIYSAIRWDCPLSRMTTNIWISPMKIALIWVLPFLNNPKDLDPSYKMDLDLSDCFERKKKIPSYNRRNKVCLPSANHRQYSSQTKYYKKNLQTLWFICLSGWLIGCFGFNGPLRQYFSLYRAVSQREGERGKKD